MALMDPKKKRILIKVEVNGIQCSKGIKENKD